MTEGEGRLPALHLNRAEVTYILEMLAQVPKENSRTMLQWQVVRRLEKSIAWMPYRGPEAEPFA